MSRTRIRAGILPKALHALQIEKHFQLHHVAVRAVVKVYAVLILVILLNWDVPKLKPRPVHIRVESQ